VLYRSRIGVIVTAVKRNGWESIDPHQLAIARELAIEAQRRAALPTLEKDEFVRKEQVESDRKCRLFAERD
jgi:hypothetical protein